MCPSGFNLGKQNLRVLDNNLPVGVTANDGALGRVQRGQDEKQIVKL